MQKTLRIGTRSSQLAVWQATLVQKLLKENGVDAELVFIKSEGDMDTVTPLYALGVTGIFTKTLDAALLSNRIDIAVHSMKDVPTQLAKGIAQAAVLKRGNHRDIFVPHPEIELWNCTRTVKEVMLVSQGSKTIQDYTMTFPLFPHPVKQGEWASPVVATGSIRRIAQWKNRFPDHETENIRGNVNTRLQKLKESNWHGAIFAAAGLERIGLRPANAIDLDWMLPAPAQGAIMVVCREGDKNALQFCRPLNDEPTALCTKIERDFLSTLMGGCSTPISGLAQIKNGEVHFEGNIVSVDGTLIAGNGGLDTIERATDMGYRLARQLLSQPNVLNFIETIRNGKT